jgi:hypothetical protein
MPTQTSVRQWWKEVTSHNNYTCFWFWMSHWSAIVAGRFLCSEGSCVSQTDAYVLSANSICCACYLDRILTQWQYQASLKTYTWPFLHCDIPHEKCFKLEHIKAYGLWLRFNVQCSVWWTLQVVPFQLHKQTCATGITRSKYWPLSSLCTLTSIEFNGNCLRSFGDGTCWGKMIPYTFISQVAPSRLCLCLEMFRIIVNVCVCVCVCVCPGSFEVIYLPWKKREVKLNVKANKLLRYTSRKQFFQHRIRLDLI